METSAKSGHNVDLVSEVHKYTCNSIFFIIGERIFQDASLLNLPIYRIFLLLDACACIQYLTVNCV